MYICRDVEALLETDPLLLYKKSFGPKEEVEQATTPRGNSIKVLDHASPNVKSSYNELSARRK